MMMMMIIIIIIIIITVLIPMIADCSVVYIQEMAFITMTFLIYMTLLSQRIRPT